MSIRLLIATGNRGKLREFEALLGSGFALEGLAAHPEVKLPPEGADYAAKWSKDGSLGTYHYTAQAKEMSTGGALDALNFEYIKDTGAAMVGDPDRCIEIAKRYEAAGCDLLFCLINPYNMTHAQNMDAIKQLGRYVIPEFAR